jgi:hypothetical protein
LYQQEKEPMRRCVRDVRRSLQSESVGSVFYAVKLGVVSL